MWWCGVINNCVKNGENIPLINENVLEIFEDEYYFDEKDEMTFGNIELLHHILTEKREWGNHSLHIFTHFTQF